MMLQKLRLYLWWKGKLNERKQDGKSHFGLPDVSGLPNPGFQKTYGDGDNISDALKKKDRERAERAGNRRRVRGGAPANSEGRGETLKPEPQDSALGSIQDEANSFAQL
jgi:DNA excision repair protein ERCC-4